MSQARKVLSVTSRVNGLQVDIPPDAAGVINRFQSKGDNELIFNKPNARGAVEKPMIVESESTESSLA